MIPELQQRRELLLIELLNTDVDVMRQDEVEENPLLAVESRADLDIGLGRALCAGESG